MNTPLTPRSDGQPVIAVGTPEARRHAPWRSTERDITSARGDGRTLQGSLLIMAPIVPDLLPSLRGLLLDIQNPPGGEDLEDNPIIPFRRLQTVHFARILIHDASPSATAPIPEWQGEPQASGEPIPATLLFATDFDGPLADHLDELLREAGDGIAAVFRHCEGWPGANVGVADRDSVLRFLHQHRVHSNTFYTGTMNRSVAQIHREAELREFIERCLDALQPRGGADPLPIRAALLTAVETDQRFAWARMKPGRYPSPKVPRFVVERPLAAAAGLLVALIVLAFLVSPAAGAALVAALAVTGLAGFGAYRYLCRLASRDPVILPDDVQAHTARLAEAENRIVQNQMSSVIYIKRPLWFRRFVLQGVLAFINFSAKYLSNEGTLAGIPSIHFARWVIVDNGRRLVFFSNFDGSWENYLGDFIDKAHAGLTAVWSNCVGFPRTVGLTGKGATDEQRFKAYSRQSQVQTQVWYSAYRWLSVSNINDNSRLRLGLYGEMNAEQAAAWLRMATPRASALLPRKEQSADPLIELRDVQGLVRRSYAQLREAMYVPVTFPSNDGAAPRAWLAHVLQDITRASLSRDAVDQIGQAMNIAFTYQGLVMLGIEQEDCTGFSREFREGMAEQDRQRLLGDCGAADPKEWRWGGPHNEPLHAMLFVYASTRESLREAVQAQEASAARFGVAFGAPLTTIMLPGDKEHFGFHDGIAQPRIAGMQGDSAAVAAASTIPAGEVVLGYPNAYGVNPMSPTVRDSAAARQTLVEAARDESEDRATGRRDLGRNGSYVVFRQLHQDVTGFWRFIDRHAQSDPARRKYLAAKMVGRWPNGAPLVKYPDAEPSEYDRKKANDFWYKDDLAGNRCPVGSHIRRSNPRDGLQPNRSDSLLVADRHRMLRRGRAYGEPVAKSLDPSDILSAPEGLADRGLHFICFNTDLARQFEFVQNTWINNMKFDGLYRDPDPVVAPHVAAVDARHPEEVSRFTIQQSPVRQRLCGLPRFVTMVGGAYLFMPGLNALKYLSDPARD